MNRKEGQQLGFVKNKFSNINFNEIEYLISEISDKEKDDNSDLTEMGKTKSLYIETMDTKLNNEL